MPAARGDAVLLVEPFEEADLLARRDVIDRDDRLARRVGERRRRRTWRLPPRPRPRWRVMKRIRGFPQMRAWPACGLSIGRPAARSRGYATHGRDSADVRPSSGPQWRIRRRRAASMEIAALGDALDVARMAPPAGGQHRRRRRPWLSVEGSASSLSCRSIAVSSSSRARDDMDHRLRPSGPARAPPSAAPP